jgi:hypothetical protein
MADRARQFPNDNSAKPRSKQADQKQAEKRNRCIAAGIWGKINLYGRWLSIQVERFGRWSGLLVA